MVRFLLLWLWILAIGGSSAQKISGQTVYKAHVSDAEGNAVEYATAVLLSGEKQVEGTVANSDGDFSMEAEAGKYRLVVQCLGYEPLRKELILPIKRRDSLILDLSNHVLREVVVQAKNIERKADRFIMSVMPSAGKDGTELLSQAPGVWLSDETISINGAQGTKVFVDDREIRLTGEELLAYLRSLKSEDIKRIEVIPIAGVEYEASTKGGVIKISLRRRPDNGMQGYVSLGTSLSPSLQGYIPSASVNARVGKWSLNGAVSGTFTPRDKGEMNSNREYGTVGNKFVSQSLYDTDSKYGNGRVGAIFEIDSLNSVGAEIEYINQASDGTSWSQTDLVKNSYPMKSTGNYRQKDDYNTFSATVNYLREMDDRGSVFKVIADYVSKRSTGDNFHTICYEQSSWSYDTVYRSHAAADYDMATTDISFQKNLREKMSLKIGTKYAYTLMDDHSLYEGVTSSGSWIPNEEYGYTLRYNENIVGAYASFSTEIKNWSFAAGVRAEYSKTSDRSEDFSRDYLDLFPNLSVTYAFDPIKRWMLVGQYARNIERPPFYTLNPNRIQSSDYSYQIGNPYLRPTYINRFSVTLVYNYRYTVTVGGNLHHDLIREFCKQDVANPDVSYITYENHDRENHWFVAVSLPYQPFTWCNLTGNFIGVRQDIRMTELSSFLSHYLGFANAIATFALPAGFTVEARYSGTSRLYSGNSEVAPRHTVGVMARKKLFNDKLLLAVSVDNIFNQANEYASTLDVYRTSSRYENGLTGRVFKVALTWNFNSGKKVRKSKIEIGSGSERSRLNEK